MKAVTEANWIFPNIQDINDLFQKFTQAVGVVIKEGKFIPPSVSTPSENARYIIFCFREEQQKNEKTVNDFSFEKSVSGMTAIYNGTNGTLGFNLNYDKGTNSAAEISYIWNEETNVALSVERLEAMILILGMPDFFSVELSGDDRKKILSHKHNKLELKK